MAGDREGPESISVGQKLREFRFRNDLTQVALGQILHVRPQTIGSWEAGRHKIQLHRLAAIQQLLGGAGVQATPAYGNSQPRFRPQPATANSEPRPQSFADACRAVVGLLDRLSGEERIGAYKTMVAGLCAETLKQPTGQKELDIVRVRARKKINALQTLDPYLNGNVLLISSLSLMTAECRLANTIYPEVTRWDSMFDLLHSAASGKMTSPPQEQPALLFTDAEANDILHQAGIDTL